eukprot:gene23492-27448_t
MDGRRGRVRKQLMRELTELRRRAAHAQHPITALSRRG